MTGKPYHPKPVYSLPTPHPHPWGLRGLQTSPGELREGTVYPASPAPIGVGLFVGLPQLGPAPLRTRGSGQVFISLAFVSLSVKWAWMPGGLGLSEVMHMGKVIIIIVIASAAFPFPAIS